MTPRSTPNPDAEPILMSWSGGKDSALALQMILHNPLLRVEALLTTVTDGYDRVSMHGVRRTLLEAQAAAIGLPLEQVRIPVQASNESYEQAMREALTRHKARGVSRVAFGDLFLEEIRAYREEKLAAVDMTGIFPLWRKDTRTLSHDFIEQGFRAILVCVDPSQLHPLFCGREFDWPMLADLPATLDPCGENGEFHTFVYDGPIFYHPLDVVRGEVVERDGFVFCDLDLSPAAKRATSFPSRS